MIVVIRGLSREDREKIVRVRVMVIRETNHSTVDQFVIRQSGEDESTQTQRRGEGWAAIACL